MMEQIKKLRDMTGAGISDCKKALTEAKNEINKAVEILRKTGAVKAAKKCGREAKEGVVAVFLSKDKKTAGGAIIYCETDFVARNETFINFTLECAKEALTSGAKNYFESKKNDMILKLGENLLFGKEFKLSGEYVNYYVHSNLREAAMVAFNKKIDDNKARDIAMQVVAMKPIYLKPEDVSWEEVEKEKNIYRQQLEKEGKPEQIIDKIMEGKINRYYEEICLNKQAFIKEDKKKVEDILEEGTKITSFTLLAL